MAIVGNAVAVERKVIPLLSDARPGPGREFDSREGMVILSIGALMLAFLNLEPENDTPHAP